MDVLLRFRCFRPMGSLASWALRAAAPAERNHLQCCQVYDNYQIWKIIWPSVWCIINNSQKGQMCNILTISGMCSSLKPSAPVWQLSVQLCFSKGELRAWKAELVSCARPMRRSGWVQKTSGRNSKQKKQGEMRATKGESRTFESVSCFFPVWYWCISKK